MQIIRFLFLSVVLVSCGNEITVVPGMDTTSFTIDTEERSYTVDSPESLHEFVARESGYENLRVIDAELRELSRSDGETYTGIETRFVVDGQTTTQIIVLNRQADGTRFVKACTMECYAPAGGSGGCGLTVIEECREISCGSDGKSIGGCSTRVGF